MSRLDCNEIIFQRKPDRNLELRDRPTQQHTSKPTRNKSQTLTVIPYMYSEYFHNAMSKRNVFKYICDAQAGLSHKKTSHEIYEERIDPGIGFSTDYFYTLQLALPHFKQLTLSSASDKASRCVTKILSSVWVLFVSRKERSIGASAHDLP